MSKVDLTLGETATKVDLTLETVNQNVKWSQANWTWADAKSRWGAPKASLTLETATKVDLTLENV